MEARAHWGCRATDDYDDDVDLISVLFVLVFHLLSVQVVIYKPFYDYTLLFVSYP
jgi:hypothetical protein